MNKKIKVAFEEITSGILSWRIWLLLGWQDIRIRYRRSQIGPFWITLSMAITIYTMGFLYGKLLNMDLKQYFPFLAAGMLTWSLISTTITESTNAIVEAANYCKQIKIPFIVFTFRVVTKNLIIFAHNLLALVPIIIYFRVPINLQTLSLFIVGLAIVIVNGVAYGFVLGMIGARFRDMSQIIVSLIQVTFFLTPVIWEVRNLPEQYRFLARLNPFTQFINIIRAPLIGQLPTTYDYSVTLIITAIGIMLMFILFYRIRQRIIYWL